LIADLTIGLPLVWLITYAAFVADGVYRGVWRFAGLEDAQRFAFGSVLAALLLVIGQYFCQLHVSGFDRSTIRDPTVRTARSCAFIP
jgi:FlaA1/EpsC-like NDP-sugar epimerase